MLKKLSTKRTNNEINKWKSKLNSQFSEEVQMENKNMKKCLTFLAIKEIHIKTTLRFHLTLGRLAIIKKTNSNKCW
jgi:hypothetical protein